MFCKCSPKYVSCSFYLPRRIVEMSDIIGRYCPEERTQRFSRRELRSLRAAWSPRGLLAIHGDVSSDIGIREADNIQPIICGVCWGTLSPTASHQPYLRKLLQYSAISVQVTTWSLMWSEGNFTRAMLSSSARHFTRVPPRQCHQLFTCHLFHNVSLLDELEYRGLIQNVTR